MSDIFEGLYDDESEDIEQMGEAEQQEDETRAVGFREWAIGKQDENREKGVSADPPADYSNLEVQKTQEQVRKLRIDNDLKEGKAMPSDLVHGMINEIGQSLRNNFIDQAKRNAPIWAATLGVPERERDIEMMISEMVQDGIQGVKGDIRRLVEEGAFM